MSNSLFSNDAYFSNIKNIFSLVTKNFFELFNTKNKLVIIESLFRFSGPMHKNQILSNYECTEIAEEYEPNGNSNTLNNASRNNFSENNQSNLNAENKQNYSDGEADAVYDGKILFERDLEDNQIKKPKNKKKEEENYLENLELVKWTENEDLVLIDNYFEFKDSEDYLDILDKLFPLKTLKDIKNRIKTLKLKKGQEKAMKVLLKIHEKKKEKEENLFNVIIELSDECRNEAKKQKIEKTISAIKEQLKSYKLKKDLFISDSPEIDCVLIPTSSDEIDVFKNKKFMEFIKNIGFVPPADLDADAKITVDNNYNYYNNNNAVEVIDLTKNENLENAKNYKNSYEFINEENNKNEKMDLVENHTTNNLYNEEGDMMDIADEYTNNKINNDKNENKEINKPNNDSNKLNKFWKINPLSDATDIEIMIEKLHNFEKVINENTQVNEEYEEIKRKNKKDKKDKKKKHKKDKKKKHKKDKKNKKHKSYKNENYKENSESENGDFPDEEDEMKSSRSGSENNENSEEKDYDPDLFVKNQKLNGNNYNNLNDLNSEFAANDKSEKNYEENDLRKQSSNENLNKNFKKSKKNKFSKENFYAEAAGDAAGDDAGNHNMADDNGDVMNIEDNAKDNKNDLDELEFLNYNYSKNKKRLKKGVKDNNFLSEFE